MLWPTRMTHKIRSAASPEKAERAVAKYITWASISKKDVSLSKPIREGIIDTTIINGSNRLILSAIIPISGKVITAESAPYPRRP